MKAPSGGHGIGACCLANTANFWAPRPGFQGFSAEGEHDLAPFLHLQRAFHDRHGVLCRDWHGIAALPFAIHPKILVKSFEGSNLYKKLGISLSNEIVRHRDKNTS